MSRIKILISDRFLPKRIDASKIWQILFPYQLLNMTRGARVTTSSSTANTQTQPTPTDSQYNTLTTTDNGPAGEEMDIDSHDLEVLLPSQPPDADFVFNA